MSRAGLSAALLVVALLSGCGTTVPLTSARGDGATADGLSDGQDPSGLATGGTSGTPGASNGSSTTGVTPGASLSTTTAAAQGAPAPGSGSATQNGSPNGTQVTGPVDVGVWISVNSDKAYSALGFDNLGLGDNKAQAQAVVDYLNQHGGMNGRRINPIYATYDASNTDSATQEQAACATWTTDHHVVAVVSPFNFSSNLAQCLTKRSVPLLYENIYGYGASDFSKYALVGPGTVNLDRFADVYVSQLQRAGFFTASTTDAAKIGVLYMDTPSYRSAWEHSLKPAFARRNLTVTESQGIPLTASEQSDLQSALLRFRSAGVTRIVTMDIGSVLWTLGSTFAESQAYRPKWGLSSSSVPGTVQSATPTNQNVNVTGVGFVPLTDVDINHQPAPTRAVAQCASIMRAAGQASTSSATQVTERAYCDTLFLLERATRSATALSPGRAGLAAIFSGVNALGSSFAPSNTFSTSLSAGKHDGASAVRTFNYSQGCSCYTYTAAAVSVP